MKCIHIVGRKNHGKTTLLVELVEELVRRGLAVGVVKHSKHIHELDIPGKDSHRLRQAGGHPVAVASADLIGIFLPRRADEDFYRRLEPLFAECDIVLVEGHIDGDGPKIEVWRAAVGNTCLAHTRDDILAVVSDDRPEVSVPVWSRSDVRALAERVRSLVD
jgi:molybdopterin-guanine dinucleotide biosynthesis protein MobB